MNRTKRAALLSVVIPVAVWPAFAAAIEGPVAGPVTKPIASSVATPIATPIARSIELPLEIQRRPSFEAAPAMRTGSITAALTATLGVGVASPRASVETGGGAAGDLPHPSLSQPGASINREIAPVAMDGARFASRKVGEPNGLESQTGSGAAHEHGATEPTAASAKEPRSLAGLSAPVSVGFDAFGVPTIQAATLEDAVRVEGWLHAADRFAQMDFLRRFAAGEVSELLGPMALPQDQQQRVFRGRAVAEAAFAAASEPHRRLLRAYAEGVNAELAQRAKQPTEHAFLQVKPAPWRPEDSFLILLAMTQMLNDSARIEGTVGELAARLPDEWFEFLATPRSRWDAPVIPDERPFVAPDVPSPLVLDPRTLNAPPGPDATRAPVAPPSETPVDQSKGTQGSLEFEPDALRLAHRPFTSSALCELFDRADSEENRSMDLLTTRPIDADAHGDHRGINRSASSSFPWMGDPLAAMESAARRGSNSWVVGGQHTGGAAILANDMHLEITAPSVWYRVSILFGEGVDARRLDGISLPGSPSIVSGSNGRVAWGFTNVEGDFIDLVVVEVDPSDSERYLVPGGSEPFTMVTETLAARGGEPKPFEVRGTRWGPVVGKDRAGRPLALRWTALEPGGMNIELLDLAFADSATEALDIGARWRGPQQNLMVADARGNIGWTITGHLPIRRGWDGAIPVSWADGTRGWDGFVDGASRPRLENPPEGWIVTANQRTLPLGRAASEAGTIGILAADPDRARRIQDLLQELARSDRQIDEAACAAMQLDTLVPRLAAWRDAVLPPMRAGSSAVNAAGESTARAKRLATLVSALESWDGRADVDARAVGFLDTLRRKFRRAIMREVVAASIARLKPDAPSADRLKEAEQMIRVPALDDRFLEIAERAPAHLVPASDSDWNRFIQRLALESAAETGAAEGLLRWGQLNTSDFRHPLASALPLLGSKFGWPSHEQPGHPFAVRAATPRFGASDRLVVQVGSEADGLIQVPGGQSADPASPHYADLHASWRDGRPLPLQSASVATRHQFVPAAAAN